MTHPAAAAPAAEADATHLTVTLRDTREGLGRVVAVLRSVPVNELTYRVSAAQARATAEIVLAPSDVRRARSRLTRMVDVLSVTESATPNP